MKYFVGIVLLLVSFQTLASLVVQGTRVIFPSDKKMVSIQLINHSEQHTLTQSWVDEGNIESTPETTNAPFMVVPPINKIAANEGVQLRIHFLGDNLPMDRESIYYLNVLDIAPKPKNTNGMNTLQFALQTRIKLFYRPISLLNSVQEMIHQVKLTYSNDHITIKNPTPYFLNISKIYYEGYQEKPIAKSIMVEPFSSLNVDINKHLMRNAVVIYIDDTGSQIPYTLPLSPYSIPE